MKKQAFLISLIPIFLSVSLVLAMPQPTSDGALNFVKTAVNSVLTILQDPKYKGKSASKEQRRRLRVLAEKLIDFKEVSKRALGRNRRKFTPQQMKEFYDLFPRLLERTYLDKIQSYNNEKIVYTYDKAIMLSKNKAVVKTVVTVGPQKTPIDYRLIFRDNRWVGYDVLVEGVSLIKNYRDQFNIFLQNNSPADLLKLLRNKISTKT